MEKDKDVIAQAQAIAALEALPQLSFSVVSALNNFLMDSKVLSLSIYLVYSSFEGAILFSFIYVQWVESISTCVVQAFWRVRIEAAYALANTASEVYPMEYFIFYVMTNRWMCIVYAIIDFFFLFYLWLLLWQIKLLFSLFKVNLTFIFTECIANSLL